MLHITVEVGRQKLEFGHKRVVGALPCNCRNSLEEELPL
jgi:hypothetical protein